MKFKFFEVCFPSLSVIMIDRKSDRKKSIKILLEHSFWHAMEDIFHNFERTILLQNKKKYSGHNL